MIIFVQHPLVDLRPFAERAPARLERPSWPSPTPFNEFVRYFGAVKPRGKGGLSGWVGENELCDARNALKFPRLLPFVDGEITIPLRCGSRHLYHDGLATAKTEVVLLTPRLRETKVRKGRFLALLEHVLTLPVDVCVPEPQPARGRHEALATPVRTTLFAAGKPLARLFQYASSTAEDYRQLDETELVEAGQPLLFVEVGHGEQVVLPWRSKSIDLTGQHGIALREFWHNEQNMALRVIVLHYTDPGEKAAEIGRQVRLYLMRLHAEFEGVRAISRQVQSEQIAIEPYSKASHNLQEYFNEATRRISDVNKRAGKYVTNASLERLGQQVLEALDQGERHSVLALLDRIEARPQIQRKMKRFYRMDGGGPMSDEGYRPQTWERVIVYGAGLFFLGVVSYLVVRNEPIADPNLVVLIRMVLSLVVAVFGATVPGLLNVSLSGPGLLIRAGGALALFVITYLLTPAVL